MPLPRRHRDGVSGVPLQVDELRAGRETDALALPTVQVVHLGHSEEQFVADHLKREKRKLVRRSLEEIIDFYKIQW